jgi:DNA (cytosine-5)-methyltransferase 1
MRILDLFCGAGGASKGYAEAGFEVIGVDHKAQQNYPYEFIKMDAFRAMKWLNLGLFDAIHASPPCQYHSTMRYRNEDRPAGGHEIRLIRAEIARSGLPYVIENVTGAKDELELPTMLCGSMFGLDVRRHRLFETNFTLVQPECQHEWQVPRFPNPDPRGKKRLVGVVNVYGACTYPGEREDRERAMGIDWMSNVELTQAIPPAYTRFVGEALARHLWGLEPAPRLNLGPEIAALEPRSIFENLPDIRLGAR